MKKIVIINPGSFVYGAERGLVNLILALRKKFDVSVILPRQGPLSERLRKELPGLRIKFFPLPVLMFSFSPLYYLGFFIRSVFSIAYLIFYVLYNKVDIISTNSLLLIFPGIVARLTRKTHIWHIREFFLSTFFNKT